jgi:type II secretion system protein N
MNERLRKLLSWVGYPTFALFSFLAFLYLTFPMERLKPRLEQRASAELGMEVTIDEVSPRPLLGLSAEGVTLVSRPAPGAMPARSPDGSTVTPKPARIRLDQVVLKVGLLGLIFGGVDLSFSVQGLGGELEGSYEQSASKTAPSSPAPPIPGRKVVRPQDWALRAELQKIDLASLPAVREAVGLPLSGRLSGKAALEVPEARWSSANGSLELDLEDCSIGDGKAKLKVPGNPLLAMGVTLPRVRIGRLHGQISIEKGVATVRLTSQDRVGEVDIEADIEGRIGLRNPLPYSSLDVYARIRLNPQLKKRDAKFELFENGLASARRPDGSYGVQISGILRQPMPRLTPIGGSGGGLPPGRYRTPGGASLPLPPAGKGRAAVSGTAPARPGA